ncbi:hypothetical protein K7432_005524 [Basidiobolus ranarum]|uniref:Uncharacterized protein n=1 Tax=Basidiobolus ranarum TaxID=34480 RepID=A0ABR2WWJ4_9FUNG
MSADLTTLTVRHYANERESQFAIRNMDMDMDVDDSGENPERKAQSDHVSMDIQVITRPN